jgi:CBS domain containing-hemolysin-like protein
MAALGRVPEVGDEVLVGDVRLSVESMARRRVERVLVRPAEAGAGAAADPATDEGGAGR